MKIFYLTDIKFIKLRYFGFLNLDFVYLLLLFFLPHFLFVFMGLSSLALGLLLASCFCFLSSYKSINLYCFNNKERIFLCTAGALLFFYGFLGFWTTSQFKPLLSLFIVLLFFLVFYLYRRFSLYKFEDLYKNIFFLFLIILFFGWISIFFDLEFMNYTSFSRPVFPFSEPSHYALTLGVLSVSLVSVSSILISFFIVLNIFLLALLFPNLTMLVYFFLCFSILSLRFNFIYIIYAALCSLLVTMVALPVGRYAYFFDRLSLLSSDNLSVLVWIQGWELAYVNFVETGGLGLGFNSLGLSSTVISSVTTKILKLHGSFLNVQDGGFLASKFIAEFGIVGLFCSICYFFWIIHFFGIIKKMYRLISLNIDHELLAEFKKYIVIISFIFSFSVEFFFRGYGYFSPNLVLALASIWYILRNKLKLPTIL